MVLTEVSRSRGTRFVAALAAAILAVPITTANAADTVLWLNGTESVVPGPPPSGPPGGPISVLHGAYGTNVVTVKYPASFWPLTAAADPTGPVLGVSVDEGIANLHKAIGSTSGTVAVVGTSQGSLVVDDVQDDLDRTGAQPDADLTFVATADPQGATGLFTVFLPTGTHIPILEYTTRAAPVESAFDRVDITYQYDGVGNFPDRPWNLLADLNAILGGFYLHPLTQWADLSTVPESNITTTTNSRGATITTYLVPAPYLPLTRPLEQLGVPTGIVHALDSMLIPIINKGYSNLTPEDGPHLSHGKLIDTATTKPEAPEKKPSPRSVTADRPEPVTVDDDDEPTGEPAAADNKSDSDADKTADEPTDAPRSHEHEPAATAPESAPPKQDSEGGEDDKDAGGGSDLNRRAGAHHDADRGRPEIGRDDQHRGTGGGHHLPAGHAHVVPVRELAGRDRNGGERAGIETA